LFSEHRDNADSFRRRIPRPKCYLSSSFQRFYVWIYRHEKSMSVGAGTLLGSVCRQRHFIMDRLRRLPTKWVEARECRKLSQMTKYAAWILGNNHKEDSWRRSWNNVFTFLSISHFSLYISSFILKWATNCRFFRKRKKMHIVFLFQYYIYNVYAKNTH